MPHLALVVPVWVGHLNPMVTLGRELQRRGHQVTAVSFPDAASRVARAGLAFAETGAASFPSGEWERMTRRLSGKAGIPAAFFTIGWIARIVRVMLEELPGKLRQGRFDGVVMDQVCFGAEWATAQAGLPLAVVCNALPVHFQPDIPPHSETWPWTTGRWAILRNRLVQGLLLQAGRKFWGPIRARVRGGGGNFEVRQYLNELPPSLVQVAQLPACLDFPRRHSPDHFHHTGPWHDAGREPAVAFDDSWLDGRPLVFASLGTLQNGLDSLYQVILDACADLPVQVLLTLGREGGRMPGRIPSNARVLGYGPQLAILRRASMVITHAGMNTTLESLAQGLPMVALPITNEQPGIAARIRHAGVGEWLPIRGLRPGRLRALVERVLTDPGYRRRASSCAAQLARESGLSRAGEILEQAMVERRRVIRK